MLTLKKSASAYLAGGKKVSTYPAKSTYSKTLANNIRSLLIFISADTYSNVRVGLTGKLYVFKFEQSGSIVLRIRQSLQRPFLYHT